MTLINPYTRWRVSQGWEEGSHGVPGGGPAIDYAVPHGSLLLSPAAGRVSLSQGGAGGLVTILVLPNGRQIINCHNSEFLVRHGEEVDVLQPLSLSGNTGRVSPAPTPWAPYRGSHLHTYGLFAGGARWNWTRDATVLGIPAGGGRPLEPPADIDIDDEEKTMQVFGYIKPTDKNRTTYVTMDFVGGCWKETVSNDENYGRSIAVNWGGGAPMLSLGDRNDYLSKFNKRWPGVSGLLPI